ncbi:MAG: FIST C-terminal domain-containing protein [Motiliproteus sp.]|nr:FIST C-terminal domain-containing protein [Motiliproteus sp.]MCW9050811.1 FIST C-terminal domain-containing protein [Motiliproteus sp.]
MEPKIISCVCHSTDVDPYIAVDQLLVSSHEHLGSRIPQAAILFAGVEVDLHTVSNGLFTQWPDLQLIGCSTDGEFSSVEGFTQNSLVLVLFASDCIDMVAGYVDNRQPDLGSECRSKVAAARQLSSQQASLCILLSDVLEGNGESVVSNFTEAFNNQVPVIGGMAGDNWQFSRTFQLCNTDVYEHGSVFLLFAGPLQFSYGVDCGWEAVGEMGTITRSQDNVLYEIDHQPALNFYRDALGKEGLPNVKLPLAVYDSHQNFRFMRTSFSRFDSGTGAVTYSGNMPENNNVRITVVNSDSIISGTENSAQKATQNFPVSCPVSLALCFSCGARRAMLGKRTSEEFRCVERTVGEDIPIAGFYTYGEFCPPDPWAETEFHNETFVTLLIG